MNPVTVHLPFATRPRSEWVSLSFAPGPLLRGQARLEGRVEWEPQLKLDRFQCKAVIDRVILRFDIGRPTQAVSLQRKLAALHGVRSPFVDPVGCRRSVTCFDLTVQEPTTAVLLRIADYLQTSFGLKSAPQITLLEVSLDFWPKGASQEEEMRLFGILQRTYLPSPDVWSPRKRPRSVFGKAKQERRFVFPPKDGPYLFPEDLQLAVLDGTFYLGERGADWELRLMRKTLDSQNPKTGARTILPPDQQRVRMEVVLRGTELEKLKLRRLDDLVGFKFTRLQGAHFRFMLPTFPDPNSSSSSKPYMDAVRSRLDSKSLDIFARAGIAGLEAERRSRDVLREGNKAQIRALRDQMPPAMRGRPSRQGTGVKARYKAYDELNSMVQHALACLAKRKRTALQ